jgi:hypothetical protein
MTDSPREAQRNDAYHKAASLLRNMPQDFLPGIPRWTAEELAEHDLQMSLLSDEELAQLESFRFQETRKQQWPDTPVVSIYIAIPLPMKNHKTKSFEMEYGSGNVMPARPIRPWERRSKDGGIPSWLQHRQLKKKRRTGQWDPAVKPVYPTFVFTGKFLFEVGFSELTVISKTAARWEIPDNTRYTRKEINDAVVNYLKTLLVEKLGYWEFVESKGRSLPLLDLLRQNFFAKCMLYELTKIRCPPILPVSVNVRLKCKLSRSNDEQQICGGSIVTKVGRFPLCTKVLYHPLIGECSCRTGQKTFMGFRLLGNSVSLSFVTSA